MGTGRKAQVGVSAGRRGSEALVPKINVILKVIVMVSDSGWHCLGVGGPVLGLCSNVAGLQQEG